MPRIAFPIVEISFHQLRKKLEKRFKWLAMNPLPGKHRTDVAEDYYSFPKGQHVVFYLINQASIDIIGLPHKDMDIIYYFQPFDYESAE